MESSKLLPKSSNSQHLGTWNKLKMNFFVLGPWPFPQKSRSQVLAWKQEREEYKVAKTFCPLQTAGLQQLWRTHAFTAPGSILGLGGRKGEVKKSYKLQWFVALQSRIQLNHLTPQYSVPLTGLSWASKEQHWHGRESKCTQDQSVQHSHSDRRLWFCGWRLATAHEAMCRGGPHTRRGCCQLP